MSIFLLLALCLEPRIEYTLCSASAESSAGKSRENFWRWLPKGASPDTLNAFMPHATCLPFLNAMARNGCDFFPSVFSFRGDIQEQCFAQPKCAKSPCISFSRSNVFI